MEWGFTLKRHGANAAIIADQCRAPAPQNEATTDIGPAASIKKEDVGISTVVRSIPLTSSLCVVPETEASMRAT